MGGLRPCPMIAALILLGAVCFTLVAAYQFTMFADRDWRTVTWSAVMAIILWQFGFTELRLPRGPGDDRRTALALPDDPAAAFAMDPYPAPEGQAREGAATRAARLSD
jgi:hypothetical protein